MMQQATLTLVPVIAGLLVTCNLVTSQCAGTWQPGAGAPGVDGTVYASTMWDPDGAGPLPEHLVIGGSFFVVGQTSARGLAMLNPLTGVWSGFGSGVVIPTVNSNFGGAVHALTVSPAGELVIGGSFSQVDGVPANGIASFDGSSWSAFGSGISAGALHYWNGTLIAGTIGSTTNYIAAWDGTSWVGLGTGVNGSVEALATMPGGDLVAGGFFTNAGGVPVGRIARWDGSAWSAFPTQPGMTPLAMAIHNGELVVAGAFATNTSGVSRWTGGAWVPMGSVPSTSSNVYALISDPSGDLLAGGVSDAGSLGMLCKWDGVSEWEQLGQFDGLCHTVASLGTNLTIVGGAMRQAEGIAVAGLAAFSSGQWVALANTGTNDDVELMAKGANGKVVAAGKFTRIEGVPANRVACWDGTTWSDLGASLDPTLEVRALLVRNNGRPVLAGSIEPGGVSSDLLIEWDGSAWVPIGGSAPHVRGLAEAPNGDLLVGLDSGVERWDGVAWTPVGSLPHPADNLVVMDSGEIYVASAFGWGGVFAHWDGVSWSVIDNASYRAIAVAPSGDIVVGGWALMGGTESVARWDGSTMHSLGFGGSGGAAVLAIAFHPDGTLVVAGVFSEAAGNPADFVARRNGSSWQELDGGVAFDIGNAAYVAPRTLVVLPDGEVMLGGPFRNAGGAEPRSPYLARLATDCVADVADLGGGCASSAGNNELVANNDPWLGTVFSSRGSGLPAFAFAFAAIGLVPISAPLSVVLPQAAPGCDLLLTPDFVDVLVSNGGNVDYALAIPNSPALAGGQLYHQLVVMEVNGSLQVVEITSTNALRLDLGSW